MTELQERQRDVLVRWADARGRRCWHSHVPCERCLREWDTARALRLLGLAERHGVTGLDASQLKGLT